MTSLDAIYIMHASVRELKVRMKSQAGHQHSAAIQELELITWLGALQEQVHRLGCYPDASKDNCQPGIRGTRHTIQFRQL